MKIKTLARYGFFHLLSANFLTQFLGFGTVLLIVKFLTPQEFGEIKIIQSYMGAFLLMATLGLNSGILKYCSEERDKLEKLKILHFSLKKIIYTSVVTFVLLIVFVLLNQSYHSLNAAFWFFIYALSLPFAAVTLICIAYLQALNEIRSMAKVQCIIKLQSMVVIVLLTWIFGFGGFIIGTVLAYMIATIPIMKQIDIRKVVLGKAYNPSGFMKFSFSSFGANFISYIGNFADLFILDKFSSDRADIGYYALAGLFIMAAMQVNGTVQSIVTPYFSKNSSNKTWIVEQIKKNQLKMIFISFGISVCVYLVAYLLVNCFYDVEYKKMLDYLSIFLIKYLIYSSYCILGAAILALGFAKYNFITVLITTPIALYLSYYFLINYGTIGVAYSQIFTTGLILFISLFWIFKILKKYKEKDEG